MARRGWNALLGAWLVAAGFLLGPSSPQFANHLVVGICIFLVAVLAMGAPQARALNVAFGAWMVLSPFVFRYMAREIAVNDIVVGILVVSVALSRQRAAPRAHGPGGRAGHAAA